jgi:hypothetical protein
MIPAETGSKTRRQEILAVALTRHLGGHGPLHARQVWRPFIAQEDLLIKRSFSSRAQR